MIKIHGKELDKNGRCAHWHGPSDVVALLCGKCGKYYACYSCHDEMEDHPFEATGSETEYPVVCGNCMTRLTREEYMTGACPHCKFAFNPGCCKHYDIYFK